MSRNKINGRSPRLSVGLKYLLTEITAILPKEMLHNVIFVFTNTKNPLMLTFDPDVLKDYFQMPIDEYFCIENPYCCYESYDKSGRKMTTESVKYLKEEFNATAMRGKKTRWCS